MSGRSYLQCAHCRRPFLSPFQAPQSVRMTMSGSQTSCPCCHKATSADKPFWCDPRVDPPSLWSAVADFVAAINELYGYFLDTTFGLRHSLQQFLAGEDRTRAVCDPGTDIDTLPFLYGIGDPNAPDNRLLHATTRGEYRRRNEPGGRNFRRAGQLVLVLLYEYWESTYLERISNALGKDRAELLVPLIGDLRLIRNDVVHCRGVISKDTHRKVTTITCSEGLEIYFSDEAFEQLIREMKGALDRLVTDAGLPDPQHRTLWSVE